MRQAILDAEPACSGAMFYAAFGVVGFVRKNGWKEYCALMRKAEERRRAADCASASPEDK